MHGYYHHILSFVLDVWLLAEGLARRTGRWGGSGSETHQLSTPPPRRRPPPRLHYRRAQHLVYEALNASREGRLAAGQPRRGATQVGRSQGNSTQGAACGALAHTEAATGGRRARAGVNCGKSGAAARRAWRVAPSVFEKVRKADASGDRRCRATPTRSKCTSLRTPPSRYRHARTHPTLATSLPFSLLRARRLGSPGSA